MKRYKNLFEQVYTFHRLLEASRKAYRGSGMTQESAHFVFHLETEVLELSRELEADIYIPAPYRQFRIYEPKERVISAATFRDRVVHHAIVGVLEPIYESIFIHDSYATRKGKGTHAARRRAQEYLKQNEWFLKSDVEKYFDSIHHDTLLEILARKIRDRRMLHLLELIVRHGGSNGVGLPIGNLTSQFLANVYLDPLDHFIKEKLRIRYYLRYMDDFVLFSPDKEQLKDALREVRVFLETRLHLRLKPEATYLNHAMNGLSFLGARIYPRLMRIRRENLYRVLRRFRRHEASYDQGKMNQEEFAARAQSCWAYLAGFDSLGLRKQIDLLHSEL